MDRLREAQLTILGSGLENKRMFLRELMLDVEMELDDFGYRRYKEDQIARCIEEGDHRDIVRFKAEILDLMMHALGLAPYERKA